ncbi:hypothetical protein SprV_0100253500 [Sparganum proliferum]
MGTQLSSPGNMVCADAGVEVTKDKQLIHLRHRRQDCAAGHRRNVHADDGGEFASPERQAEAHQAINDTLRQTGQLSHDVVSDGEGGTRVSSLCPGATAPEGVTGTHLIQLTLLGEPGLYECSDVHLVSRQFPSH